MICFKYFKYSILNIVWNQFFLLKYTLRIWPRSFLLKFDLRDCLCDNWKPSFLPRLIYNWCTFSRRVTACWWRQWAKNQVSTNQNSRKNVVSDELYVNDFLFCCCSRLYKIYWIAYCTYMASHATPVNEIADVMRSIKKISKD